MATANPNRTQVVQCRTMISQRPCHTAACSRPECARKPVNSPQSAQEPTEVSEPTQDLMGLSDADVERLDLALYTAMEDTMPGTDEWYALSELKSRLYRL